MKLSSSYLKFSNVFSLNASFDPVSDTIVREDRLRHLQLLARAAVGERQPRENVQEREEAAVPGERGPQHSARVRAHLLRVPQ